MIDVTSHDLVTIKTILKKFVPDFEVRAFGSRVTWTAKPTSDLDLVVVGKNKLTRKTIVQIKAEFEDSAIPFTVDILDWHSIAEDFKKIINKNYVTILSPDFKQSLPDGWRYYKVDEFAEVIGGGTPSTKNAEFWNGTIPWLTPKDLSDFQGRYIEKGERNISETGLIHSSARIVPTQTVLLTSRAPVGYLAIAKQPLTTNQGFRNLLVKAGFCAEFVYYLLLNNTDYLKQHAAGSTFQELSGSTLKNLEFLVPPLSEQRAIAHILGTLDDKIELNRKMNETLEAMAQAIFKSWFVDFDPVRTKAEGRQPNGLDPEIAKLFPDSFQPSEIGEIPKGWRVCAVGDVVHAVGGTTPSTSEPNFWDGSIYFATPKDMASLTTPILIDTERQITEQGLAQISSGLLPRGTVLLSSRAPIGYLAMTEIPVAINQGFIAMICDLELPNYYVLHWTKESLGTIIGNANGTTFLEISKKNFRPIKILVPSREVLKCFVGQVEQLYHRIVANLHETRTLSALRDSLLPKLLSGEMRVKGAEKFVEKRR